MLRVLLLLSVVIKYVTSKDLGGLVVWPLCEEEITQSTCRVHGGEERDHLVTSESVERQGKEIHWRRRPEHLYPGNEVMSHPPPTLATEPSNWLPTKHITKVHYKFSLGGRVFEVRQAACSALVPIQLISCHVTPTWHTRSNSSLTANQCSRYAPTCMFP